MRRKNERLEKCGLNIHWLASLLCVPILGFIFATAVYAQCPDVSYWKLDEDAIGTYVDVIGGYDGARANKAPEPSVDFVVGGAQDFDGESTGIDIPADAGGAAPFDWAGTADFTIEFGLNVPPPRLLTTKWSLAGQMEIFNGGPGFGAQVSMQAKWLLFLSIQPVKTVETSSAALS